MASDERFDVLTADEGNLWAWLDALVARAVDAAMAETAPAALRAAADVGARHALSKLAVAVAKDFHLGIVSAGNILDFRDREYPERATPAAEVRDEH